jgi:hypothetical protein
VIDPLLPSAVKVFSDVLLFPHFDLHMALTGANAPVPGTPSDRPRRRMASRGGRP